MRLHIAGLDLELHDAEPVLAALEEIHVQLEARGQRYAEQPGNPHLCRARCSACCRKGAFFAVTLPEALQWAQAIAGLPQEFVTGARRAAQRLLEVQHREFGTDLPGARDEALFTVQVAKVAAQGPACPLLEDDLCSTYAGRPFLCRAYGFPVDAFAVETADTIVFRSLCHLYEGLVPRDYVRGKDLRAELDVLSRRLAGGRDVGRFTSAEAICATLVA